MSKSLSQVESLNRELQERCRVLESTKLQVEKDYYQLQAALESERRDRSHGSEMIGELQGNYSEFVFYQKTLLKWIEFDNGRKASLQTKCDWTISEDWIWLPDHFEQLLGGRETSKIKVSHTAALTRSLSPVVQKYEELIQCYRRCNTVLLPCAAAKLVYPALTLLFICGEGCFIVKWHLFSFMMILHYFYNQG